MKEFTVSYGFRTFSGKIGAGTGTVEVSDDVSIDDIKKQEFYRILKKIERDYNDEDLQGDYNPFESFEQLSVSVKQI